MTKLGDRPRGVKQIHIIHKSILILICILLSLVALYFGLQIFLPYFPEPIGSRAELFIIGAKTTVYLTMLSSCIGLFLGLVLGLAKNTKNKIFSLPATLIVWVIQGTPLIVQILFCYYALPELLPWLALNEFSAAVLALSLNVGAYNAEVIRAGIEAVAIGQVEAAKSLGLSRAQSMRYVVMPQALKIVIPPLINNVIALSKDSSLASAIGLLELTLAGQRISSETFLPVPVLTTIALIYLLLTFLITAVTYLAKRYL